MIYELIASSKFWSKKDKNGVITEPKDRYNEFTSFRELMEFLKRINYSGMKAVELEIKIILNDDEYEEAKKNYLKEMDDFGKDTLSHFDHYCKDNPDDPCCQWNE